MLNYNGFLLQILTLYNLTHDKRKADMQVIDKYDGFSIILETTTGELYATTSM